MAKSKNFSGGWIFLLERNNFESFQLNEESSGETSIVAMSAEVAQLKSQIQYQERRICDLQAQNQMLERKSNDLLALKAARNQQRCGLKRLIFVLCG